jgi:hypothetical protein
VDIYGPQILGNTTKETQVAKNTLFQILVLFADTENISKKYASTHKDSQLEIFYETDIDAQAISLYDKLKELALKRQRGPKIL